MLFIVTLNRDTCFSGIITSHFLLFSNDVEILCAGLEVSSKKSDRHIPGVSGLYEHDHESVKL